MRNRVSLLCGRQSRIINTRDLGRPSNLALHPDPVSKRENAKMLEKAFCASGQDRKKTEPFVRAWEHHPIGYPRLSERISLKPETGIYRRFDGLNARRILYLQAELCMLEQDLLLIEKQDKAGTKGKRAVYAVDYKCMLQEADGKQSGQIKLIAEMQRKLNQYSE